MFTGLIEEIGALRHTAKRGESLVLTIQAERVLEDVAVGDSIAVNGACLTVIRYDANTVTMDVTAETFRRTTLHRLTPGQRVNLERALPATGRFGGHIVQGHVDGTGFIRGKAAQGNTVYYTVEPDDADLLRHVIPKGSVTVDGVSLTVVDTSDYGFRVSIIPHTLGETVLQYKQPGDPVNLETDVLGKYVDHLLAWDRGAGRGGKPAGGNGGSRLSEDFLREHGF